MATFGSSVSRLPRSLFFQLLRSLIFRLLVERCRKMLEAQFSSFLIKKLAASLFFRHQKPGCQLENKATSLVFELLRSLLFRLQALFSGCKPKKQASRRIWVVTGRACLTSQSVVERARPGQRQFRGPQRHTKLGLVLPLAVHLPLLCKLLEPLHHHHCAYRACYTFQSTSDTICDGRVAQDDNYLLMLVCCPCCPFNPLIAFEYLWNDSSSLHLHTCSVSRNNYIMWSFLALAHMVGSIEQVGLEGGAC